MSIGILLSQSPPERSIWAGQDMVLGLAALDLNPQLLFEGSAVELLVKGNNFYRGVHNDAQSMQKRFKLLELFDCPTAWVVRQDLDQYGVSEHDLMLPVTVFDELEWALQLQTLTTILRY